MMYKKFIWPITRILTFIVVGLFNTILIRHEDIGSWKNYLGYFLLALAAYDIIVMLLRTRTRKK